MKAEHESSTEQTERRIAGEPSHSKPSFGEVIACVIAAGSFPLAFYILRRCLDLSEWVLIPLASILGYYFILGAVNLYIKLTRPR